MAATVTIVEKTGAGGTQTDKTSGTIRFKNADDATVDLNNTMVKPASGSDWSFEKWLRLNFAGTYTQASNAKVYTDGVGFGTGLNLWAKAVTAYATPAEGSASTGYSDAFGYTSGSALSLGAGPVTGVGEKFDHAVLLLEVQSTAAGGLLTAETLTFGWDEI